MDSVRVVERRKEYLAVYKPEGLSTVPLKSNPAQDTLLKRVAEQYPEVLSVQGKQPWEGGVLHRLDTVTRGLVLIAREQSMFDYLKQVESENRFLKEYLAQSSTRISAPLPGFGDYPFDRPEQVEEVKLTSRFRPYGAGAKAVRPVLENYSKKALAKACKREYSTFIRGIAFVEGTHCFHCTLSRGFRHQVRAHMAWSGWPLDGDELYGGDMSKPFGLTAVALSFPDPESGLIRSISIQNDYPAYRSSPSL